MVSPSVPALPTRLARGPGRGAQAVIAGGLRRRVVSKARARHGKDAFSSLVRRAPGGGEGAPPARRVGGGGRGGGECRGGPAAPPQGRPGGPPAGGPSRP